MSDWQDDLRESARSFRDVVWPEISTWLGGGELLPVEGEADREMFDVYAGIDAWQLEGNEYRMRGIASRVQKPPRLYASFTVRSRRSTGAKTEFEKRLESFYSPESGWLLPAITVQAYVNGEEMIGAGVTYTRDLYRHIESGAEGCSADYERRINGQDGNEFFVVWWERLRECGVRMRSVGDERLHDGYRPRKGWSIHTHDDLPPLDQGMAA